MHGLKKVGGTIGWIESHHRMPAVPCRAAPGPGRHTSHASTRTHTQTLTSPRGRLKFSMPTRPRVREYALGAGATKAWAPRRPARQRVATVFMAGGGGCLFSGCGVVNVQSEPSEMWCRMRPRAPVAVGVVRDAMIWSGCVRRSEQAWPGRGSPPLNAVHRLAPRRLLREVDAVDAASECSQPLGSGAANSIDRSTPSIGRKGGQQSTRRAGSIRPTTGCVHKARGGR